MYYNFNYFFKRKNKNIIYNKYVMFLKNKKNFKISRYTGYFFIFLKRYQIFKKNILKKYHIYNRIVLKKYNFLLIFIKFYLNKIFIY